MVRAVWKRALGGLKAWICGLRREQSVTRADLNVVEWDAANGLFKINPLIDDAKDPKNCERTVGEIVDFMLSMMPSEEKKYVKK